MKSKTKEQAEQKNQTDVFTDVLNGLNPAQSKAVRHRDGPLLVMAGPGTGKTQVLSARIGYLLQTQQIEPWNVLCLTFTDAGSVAMRQRLLEFIGPTAHRVNIHTFHGFCNDIIQSNFDYFGMRDVDPISDLERIELMRKLIDGIPNDNLLKRFKGDIYYDIDRLNNLFRHMKEEDWTPDLIEDHIGRYLEALPDREEYQYKRANVNKGINVGDLKQNDFNKEQKKMDLLRAACHLYPQYQKLMKQAGRYDYSDMILWVLKAFRDDPHFLQRHQEQFHFYLVDEYQDTNGAQNDLLTLLTSYWDKPDIFVVGDDDQSIFRFQGASVTNIVDYHSRYKDILETVILTENYRSSQHVLDHAGMLIEENEERLINKIPGLEKNLVAKNPALADAPDMPVISAFNTTYHEETFILHQIENLLNNGEDPNDIAIIYTMHKHADNLIKVFDIRSIPYNTARRVDVLQIPLAKKLINILRYLEAEIRKPRSGEHLLYELLHFDFLGISTRDIFKLSILMGNKATRRGSWRELLDDHLFLAGEGLDNVEAVIKFNNNINDWIREIPNIPLQQLVEKMIYEAGILQTINKSPEKLWLMEALTTFFNFIKKENAKSTSVTIKTFLSTIDLMAENKLPLEFERSIHHEHGVNLMTAHKSKGQEFKHVFMIGCTKDNWEPSKRRAFSNFSLPDNLLHTVEDSDLEEKRRLFFVGMTRAKQFLTMTYAKQADNKVKERCLFLDDILAKSSIEVAEPGIDEHQLADFNMQLLSPTRQPNLDLTEKEKLRTLLGNYRLNTTHLNNYLKCPVKFYYENMLHVPRAKNENMAFGTVAHNTLRRAYEAMKENQNFPPVKAVIGFFEHEMKKERDAFTKEQFALRSHYGQSIIEAYYNHYVDSWNKIAVTEYHVRNVEVDGVPLAGTLDKIEFDGTNAHVVDYKTGSVENGRRKLARPDKKNPNGGDYWRQLVFYKLLLDNDPRNAWEMKRGEIDFIEKNDKDAFEKRVLEITEEDLGIVRAQIKDTYHKIQNLEFENGCGEEDCEWCSFGS